jgi:hypothetical protein
LTVSYFDADGNRLGGWVTPSVSGKAEWTYVAVETPSDFQYPEMGNAKSAQIAFEVDGGQAFLDDVRFHPAPSPSVMNGDFEIPLDKKGRVSFWEAEKDTALVPGEMKGFHSLESENPGQGSSSLVVSASGDWYAFTSIPYPLPGSTDRFEASARARAGENCEVRILMAWLDSSQTVIRVDMGTPSQSSEWTPIGTGALAPPEGASLFRPILLVKRVGGDGKGAVSGTFDDAQTRFDETRVVRVAVNQVGYETNSPKSAILQTNFFPQQATANVALLNERNEKVWVSEVVCNGRMYGEKEADWGWYFWRVDFSEFDREGTFTLTATANDREGPSFPFRIGNDLLFTETASIGVDFFFVQRCGFAVPGWHAACHLDDATLPDGTHRDFTGGWHSAGDYNKLQWEYGDGGVMYALVSALEAAPDYFGEFDRDGDATCDILDESRWGAKYLAKIQNATGGLPNHIEQGPNRSTWMKWSPPEETTDNIVGTEDDPIVTPGEGSSPLAIGGWARLSALLGAKGISTDYLERAVRMWDHATKEGGANLSPLLLISTVDLYRLTKEERYLDFCRRTAEEILKGVKPDGQLAGGYGETGDVPAAALAYFGLRHPDDPLVERIKARLKAHLPHFLSEADNPLGLMMQKPGEGGYFFDPTSTMGCNYQFSSRAWSALLIYRLLGDSRALRYALDQLDFLLGKNPENLCMMEGKGSFKLPRYHHRYLTIPGRERGAVPGAIPNGFVRDIAGNDRPGVDLSTGGRQYPSYRTNEPWLVHNVFYTLAVATLHDIYAGQD